MTTGPEVIISCPECKALSRFSTMASGNTFGSTLWSDGYRYSPMLEPSVPVIQCDDCSRIFLKWKAEEVGQYFHSARDIGFDVPDKETAPRYFSNGKPKRWDNILLSAEGMVVNA